MSDTVIVAAIVALAPVLTVVITWWLSEIRRRADAKEANTKLNVIHKVVNSRFTALQATNEELRGALRGMKVLKRTRNNKQPNKKYHA